jgi:DNA-binding transcriptional LysR family regulator
MHAALAHLRLDDIATYLVVCRCRSTSAAARELSVTASQVSKAVRRLEEAFQQTLLTRSPVGVRPTIEGERLERELAEIVDRIEHLSRPAEVAQKILTIAAPSFLSPLLWDLPPSDTRLSVLELPAALIRASANDTLFDMALLSGAHRPAKSFASYPIGHLRSGLFAAARHAEELGAAPISEEVAAKLSFVEPMYLVNGRTLPGDDGCPLPRERRRFGHQAQTARFGLELVARSEQVCFCPYSAAMEFLHRGELRELEVEGWHVTTPIELWCHQDRVTARASRMLQEHLRERLARLVPDPD